MAGRCAVRCGTVALTVALVGLSGCATGSEPADSLATSSAIATMDESMTVPPAEPRHPSNPSQAPRAYAEELPPPEEWPVNVEDQGPCRDTVVSSAAYRPSSAAQVALSCAAGMVVGNVWYAIGCSRIRVDAVSDMVLGIGIYEVRPVDGFDPNGLVAFHDEGGLCGDGETAGTTWNMAFGPRFVDGTSLCDVGEFSESEARANGC